MSLQEISNVCFSNCLNLNTIKFPVDVCISAVGRSLVVVYELEMTSSCRIIGDGAFRWCHNLKLLDFGPSSPLISNKSFVDCESIEYILLPFYECEIEERAFGDMPHIKILCRDGAYDYYIPENIKNLVITLKEFSGIKNDQISNVIKKIREKANLSTEVLMSIGDGASEIVPK